MMCGAMSGTVGSSLPMSYKAPQSCPDCESSFIAGDSYLTWLIVGSERLNALRPFIPRIVHDGIDGLRAVELIHSRCNRFSLPRSSYRVGQENSPSDSIISSAFGR